MADSTEKTPEKELNTKGTMRRNQRVTEADAREERGVITTERKKKEVNRRKKAARGRRG